MPLSGAMVVIQVSLLVISQGTLAVTLKVTLVSSALTFILVLSAESSLAAAACVRVMVSLSLPPLVAASVRTASLVVSAVFSLYEMVIS